MSFKQEVTDLNPVPPSQKISFSITKMRFLCSYSDINTPRSPLSIRLLL